MPQNNTPLYIAVISLMIVSIIDLITPTEYVVDILYLCCIVIVFKRNAKIIISFCIAASLLIVINVVFFDIASKLSLSMLINRAISIFAICVTSYIAIHYRKLNNAGVAKETQYLKALKEMLFMTSHQVRKPVANILGLVDIINNTDLSADDLRQYCRYLHSSANELDGFIKELNAFIEGTEQDSRTLPTDHSHDASG